MTDKEILKRIEDRLDVAIGNYEITHEGWKNSGTDYAFTIISNTRNYIRTCKELQRKLNTGSATAKFPYTNKGEAYHINAMDKTTQHVYDQLTDEVFPTEHEGE